MHTRSNLHVTFVVPYLLTFVLFLLSVSSEPSVLVSDSVLILLFKPLAEDLYRI